MYTGTEARGTREAWKRRGQLITAQSRGCSYSINYRGWCAIGVRIIDIVAALFTVASEFIDRQRQAGWLVGWLAGWLAGWLVGWLAGWLAVRAIAPFPAPPFRRLPLQGYRVFSLSPGFRETLALTPSSIFSIYVYI